MYQFARDKVLDVLTREQVAALHNCCGVYSPGRFRSNLGSNQATDIDVAPAALGKHLCLGALAGAWQAQKHYRYFATRLKFSILAIFPIENRFDIAAPV